MLDKVGDVDFWKEEFEKWGVIGVISKIPQLAAQATDTLLVNNDIPPERAKLYANIAYWGTIIWWALASWYAVKKIWKWMGKFMPKSFIGKILVIGGAVAASDIASWKLTGGKKWIWSLIWEVLTGESEKKWELQEAVGGLGIDIEEQQSLGIDSLAWFLLWENSRAQIVEQGVIKFDSKGKKIVDIDLQKLPPHPILESIKEGFGNEDDFKKALIESLNSLKQIKDEFGLDNNIKLKQIAYKKVELIAQLKEIYLVNEKKLSNESKKAIGSVILKFEKWEIEFSDALGSINRIVEEAGQGNNNASSSGNVAH